MTTGQEQSDLYARRLAVVARDIELLKRKLINFDLVSGDGRRFDRGSVDEEVHRLASRLVQATEVAL